MPSPTDYRKLLGNKTIGQAHKDMSDKIMDYTWWNDIQSRVIYLFDYWHDKNKTFLNDIKIDENNMTPIDAKFVMYSSQTFDKDAVTFHLQFRPGQQCNVNYYDEFFKKPYDALFPIGLYALIPDEQGIYNRWLIVEKANYNVTQFPTFEILRCDKVFEWIFDGKKYRCPGVLRSQNSYNSGIWEDNSVTFPEDQYKFCVPINRDTENLYQNQRLIIDNKVNSEPRTWQVSKINRISPNGIVRITLAQDRFNSERDYIEKDSDGNIIGQWADYLTQPIEPIDPDFSDLFEAEIGYTGDKPELKIGGRYKKFNIEFKDGVFRSGSWKCFINGSEFTNVTYKTTGMKINEIGIRFDGGEDYMDSILTLKYITDDGSEIPLDVKIVSL